MVELKPWTLPAIVAALAVPVTAGFLVAGPPLGLALGALAAASLLLVAAREPRGLIETVPATSDRRHALVILTHGLDDPAAIDRVKAEGGFAQSGGHADVLVLAPAQSTLLDRWASDVGPARDEAQRKLVVSLAELGKADISARAAVGDDDIVRAVEDQLRTFPADEVILVTGGRDDDPRGERAATDLSRRLRQPFRRIVL